MPLCYRLVIEVMRRRDLNSTGSKRRINGTVRNDRNLPFRKRQVQDLTYKTFITMVIGMNRHCSITEHSLRPCCGYRYKATPIYKGYSILKKPADKSFVFTS